MGKNNFGFMNGEEQSDLVELVVESFVENLIHEGLEARGLSESDINETFNKLQPEQIITAKVLEECEIEVGEEDYVIREMCKPYVDEWIEREFK